DLQPHEARGRFPVNPTKWILWPVVANADDSCRIGEQIVRNPRFAKRLTRGNEQLVDVMNLRIDDQRIRSLDRAARREEAKRIACAHHRRPKNVVAPAIARKSDAPRYSLK